MIHSIRTNLETGPLQESFNPRASIAAIFRITPKYSQIANSSETEHSYFQYKNLYPHIFTGTLQLFFIKRANNPKDIHSGHVAFPGGKREKNESSLFTAIRETWEEVGIDLSDSKFLYLGRNNESNVYQYRRLRKLFVCMHGKANLVFLQLSDEDLKLNLNTQEVQDTVWVDFMEFTHNFQSICK